MKSHGGRLGSILCAAVLLLAAGGFAIFRFREDQQMKEAAHQLAVDWSRGGTPAKDMEWVMLLRQRQQHGYSLSDGDVDTLLSFLWSARNDESKSLPASLAYLALCRNPSRFPQSQGDRIFTFAQKMLDDPESANDARLIASNLQIMDRTGDPRAEAYFAKYKNDTRILLHEVVASHYKGRTQGGT